MRKRKREAKGGGEKQGERGRKREGTESCGDADAASQTKEIMTSKTDTRGSSGVNGHTHTVPIYLSENSSFHIFSLLP